MRFLAFRLLQALFDGALLMPPSWWLYEEALSQRMVCPDTPIVDGHEYANGTLRRVVPRRFDRCLVPVSWRRR